MCFYAEDTMIYWKMKALSPIFKNVKIVAEGSPNLWKKLTHVFKQEWKKTRTLVPILKGNKGKSWDIGEELLTGDVSQLMKEQKLIDEDSEGFVRKQIIKFEQPIPKKK